MDHGTKLGAVGAGNLFEQICAVTVEECLIRSLEHDGRVRCRKIAGIGNDPRVVDNLPKHQHRHVRIWYSMISKTLGTVREPSPEQ